MRVNEGVGVRKMDKTTGGEVVKAMMNGTRQSDGGGKVGKVIVSEVISGK